MTMKRRRRNGGPPWGLILGAAVAVGVAVMLGKKASDAADAAGSNPPGSPKRTFALTNFRFLRQADPAWSRVPIGNSNSTLGNVGCLLTSLTMISNFLRGGHLTPPDTNDIGKRTPGSFQGANTVIDVLAGGIGLTAPEGLRKRAGTAHTNDALRALIEATLLKGGVPILHVDHDGSFNSGEHFIVCLDQQGADPKARASLQESLNALTESRNAAKTPEAKNALQGTIDRVTADLSKPGGAFLCADPATGNLTTIDYTSLTGPGFSGKTYKVVGVVPVFRKGEAPATL
jgi:hypothetical protein